MSYIRPPAAAADASWFGATAYIRPPANAADASWEIVSATGVGAVTLTIPNVAGVGTHGVAGSGAITLSGLEALGQGAHTSAGVVGIGAIALGALDVVGMGAHGAAGAGAVALDAMQAHGLVAHGVRGLGVVALGHCTTAGTALHLRYELRGEVRLQGVLVNRRVRAYSRSTGELLGQGDALAGRFSVHAGFSPEECYAIPVDLDDGATDWLPPTANRLMPVLAEDAA